MPVNYEIPTPERITTLPEEPLNYLDINSINALRNAQSEFYNASVTEAGAGLLDPLAISAEISRARTEAPLEFEALTKDYLLQYIPEDHPKFDEYFAKLREFSIDHMGTESLTYGTRKADGTFEPDTAGWKKLLDYRIGEMEGIDDEPVVADPDTIAELTAEYGTLSAELTDARTNLAKLQVQFRHKGGINRPNRRKALKLARAVYEEATKVQAAKAFELARANDPAITPDQIKTLAAQFVASEFGAMFTEQTKSDYITGKYGRKVRTLGAWSLKKKVLVSGLTLAASPLFFLAGGATATAGFIGLSVFRGGKALFSGPFGHSTERGSTRILDKIAQQQNDETTSLLQTIDDSTSDSDFATILSRESASYTEKIHNSDRMRRLGSGVLTTAAVIPIVAGIVRKVQAINNHADIVVKPPIKKPDIPVPVPSTNVPDLTPEQWAGLEYMAKYPATTVRVLPGQGVLAHLKSGFNLNDTQAMNAFNALKSNNYFDGTHIAGIGTKNGTVVNYLHGMGDDTYHFSPDAVKIIKDASGI